MPRRSLQRPKTLLMLWDSELAFYDERTRLINPSNHFSYHAASSQWEELARVDLLCMQIADAKRKIRQHTFGTKTASN